MPRSIPEWIGRIDDTPVPPRVRLRALERFGRIGYFGQIGSRCCSLRGSRIWV